MGSIAKRIVGLTALAATLYAVRRYYGNWGATKEECRMRLPGDELVGEPAVQATEAVWIDAPPSAVWPWLLQTAPHWAPKGWLGSPDGAPFTVVETVPEQHLVLREGSVDLPRDAMWAFHLVRRRNDGSRLVVRARSGLRHPGEVIGRELTRAVTTLGMRVMLREVKRQAERPQLRSVTPAG